MKRIIYICPIIVNKDKRIKTKQTNLMEQLKQNVIDRVLAQQSIIAEIADITFRDFVTIERWLKRNNKRLCAPAIQKLIKEKLDIKASEKITEDAPAKQAA